MMNNNFEKAISKYNNLFCHLASCKLVRLFSEQFAINPFSSQSISEFNRAHRNDDCYVSYSKICHT